MWRDAKWAMGLGLVLTLAGMMPSKQGWAQPGLVCEGGRCLPAAEAYTAPGGTTYWVDQHHPQASDANPGTADRPWKTIGRATEPGVLRPGDAVVVRGGVYRETVVPRAGGSGPDRRITYAAYPGEQVVLSGADPYSPAWTRSGAAWRAPWTGDPLHAYGEREFRRELLVVDGQVLRPVYRPADLQPGTFFVEGPDSAPAALYVRLPGDADPRHHAVEIGRRHPLFWPVGTDWYADCGSPDQPGFLRLVGFTLRHAVNRADWGAVCPGSQGSLIEGNTAEWTNGMGFLASGRDHVFRGNRALDNGMAGFGGSCEGCLFEDNESSRNNWKGHSPFWEGGGGKWTRTRNSTWRRHLARDNDGPGLWLDYMNDGNVIEQSVFINNSVAGIFLEFGTTRTLVRNNVVHGTRYVGWTGSGLLSQAASRNVIVHNTFVANEGAGLWLRLDDERRAEDGHNVVYNNLFVDNARAAAYESYEFELNGESVAHVRTNRIDGNHYWQHGQGGNRTFWTRDVGGYYSGNSLAQWRQATGGDTAGSLLDPAAPLLQNHLAPDGWRLAPGAQALGRGVALPDGVLAPFDIDGEARPAAHPDPGADQHVNASGGGSGRAGTAPATQALVLRRGVSLVSSPIVPADPRFEAVFAGLGSNLILVKDAAGRVWAPAFGVREITAWDPAQAYQVVVSHADTLRLTGTPVEAATPLSLAAGWNYLPFWLGERTPVEQALAGLKGALTVVKSQAGAVYHPSQGINTLVHLEPGQGYKVYLTQPATLVYGAAAQGTTAPGSTLSSPATTAAQGASNTFTLFAEAPGMADGTALAVYGPRHEAVGSGRVQDGQAVLTVRGDDAWTADVVEGARPGEALRVAVEATGAAVALEPLRRLPGAEAPLTFAYEADAAWTGRLAAATALAGEQGLVPDAFALHGNYPNPFADATTIRYELREAAHVELALYDVLGRRVATLVRAEQPAGLHEARVDRHRLALAGGLYVYELRTPTLRRTERMMVR